VERMELTTSQRELLTVLANEHEEGSWVKSDALAAAADRDPGTVRNRMGPLRSLGLVEGRAGRNGGYRPTERAFEVLDRRRLDDAETLGLAHDHERLDVTVDEVEFTSVHHPERCRARLTLHDSVSRFDPGDPVVVGPSNPVTSLGPMLAVEGVEAALRETPVVAVSPFVEDEVFSGPAGELMRGVGREPSTRGVADAYPFADAFVLDDGDGTALDRPVVRTDTRLDGPEDARRVARACRDALREVGA